MPCSSVKPKAFGSIGTSSVLPNLICCASSFTPWNPPNFSIPCAIKFEFPTAFSARFLNVSAISSNPLLPCWPTLIAPKISPAGPSSAVPIPRIFLLKSLLGSPLPILPSSSSDISKKLFSGSTHLNSTGSILSKPPSSSLLILGTQLFVIGS